MRWAEDVGIFLVPWLSRVRYRRHRWARRLQNSRRRTAFHLMIRDFRPAFLVSLCFAAVLPAADTTLTLDEAVRLALEKNPQVKVEAYGRSIARADYLTAVGRFDPALAFRRSYTEDSPFASNPVVAQLIRTDDYSLAIEGTTP